MEFHSHSLVLPDWSSKPLAVCRGWKGMSQNTPEPQSFSNPTTPAICEQVEKGIIESEDWQSMEKYMGRGMGRHIRQAALGETIDEVSATLAE